MEPFDHEEPFKHEKEEMDERLWFIMKDAGEEDEKARAKEFDDIHGDDYNFDSSSEDSASATSGSEGDADSDSDTDDDAGDDTGREIVVKKQVPKLSACKSKVAVTQPVTSTPVVIDLVSSDDDEKKRKRGNSDTPTTKSANSSANKKPKSVVEFASGDSFDLIKENIQLFFEIPRGFKNLLHIGRKTVKGSTLLRNVKVTIYIYVKGQKRPELRVGTLSTLFHAGDNRDMWIHFLQRKASSFEDGVVSLMPFFRIWYTGFEEHDIIDSFSMNNRFYGHKNDSRLKNTLRLQEFAEMQMRGSNVHVNWKDNAFRSRMYFVAMEEDTPKSRFMAKVYIMCEQLLDQRFDKKTAVPIIERFSRLKLVNNVTLSKPAVRFNMRMDASDFEYKSPYEGMEQLLPRAPDSDDEILCLHSFMTRLQQGFKERCRKVSLEQALDQGYWDNIINFPDGVTICFYTVQTITKYLGVRRGSSSKYTTPDLCDGATIDEELEWEDTIQDDDVRPFNGGKKFVFKGFGWCQVGGRNEEVVNWLRHPMLGVKKENWYLSVPEGFTEPVSTSDLQVPCLDEKNTMVSLKHLKEAVKLMCVCSDTAVTEVDVLQYLKYFADYQDEKHIKRYQAASRLKQVVLHMYMGAGNYADACTQHKNGSNLLKYVERNGLESILKTGAQAEKEDLSAMWPSSSDDDYMSE